MALQHASLKDARNYCTLKPFQRLLVTGRWFTHPFHKRLSRPHQERGARQLQLTLTQRRASSLRSQGPEQSLEKSSA